MLHSFARNRVASLVGVIVASTSELACADRVAGPSCHATADTATWQFVGLRDQWVTALARTSAGVYAGTNGNGVWYTACDTGGDAWTQRGLDRLRVNDLVPVVFGGREHLLAAAAHRDPNDRTPAVVFLSRDGARTWIERDGGIAKQVFGWADGGTLVADIRVPGRLVAGLANAIILTTDFGASWSVRLGDVAAAGGPDVLAMTIAHTSSGTRIWAAGQFIDTNGFVFYSDDGGMTWHPTLRRPGGTVGDNMFVASVLADSADRNHLYAGMPNGLWETRDAGTTWSVSLRTVQIGAITALLRSANALIAVSNETEFRSGVPVRQVLGLYTSHDDGKTWSSMAVPMAARGGYSALLVDDRMLLIGTTAGVWRVHLR